MLLGPGCPNVGRGPEVGSTSENDSPVYLPVCPSSWAWDWAWGPLRWRTPLYPGSAQYTDLDLCGLLPARGSVAWRGEGLWDLPRACGRGFLTQADCGTQVSRRQAQMPEHPPPESEGPGVGSGKLPV